MDKVLYRPDALGDFEAFDLTIKHIVQVAKEIGIALPEYQTAGSAAMDLCAYLPRHRIILPPGRSTMVGTGIRLNMPNAHMAALILPRSGLGVKGLTLANTVGLIDSDYQGELKLAFKNTGNKDIDIEHGMRVAQLMFIPVMQVNLQEVVSFDIVTKRGTGGFGSTGS